MSWRIATRHSSTYRYADPVIASYNEARIMPGTRAGQRVIEAGVTTTPSVPQFTYRDYWETTVTAFDVSQPHTELVVVGSSVVETPSSRPDASSSGWDRLRQDDVGDTYSEYLLSTPYTTASGELDLVAAEYRTGATPADAVAGLTAWMRNEIDYEIGATSVSTSALEAWQARRGVCQDFAHIALVLLRGLGIPARYVSGYLHPHDEAVIGATVEGASHAWIEYWVDRWHAVDPTNGNLVGDRHVAVARGRDYADVAPFRGVYHGGRLKTLDVAVELTRLF